MTTLKPSVKALLASGLFALACMTAAPVELFGALEHGHVRARTRGFVHGDIAEPAQRPAKQSVEKVKPTEVEVPDLEPVEVAVTESAEPAELRKKKGLFDNRILRWRAKKKEFKANHVGYLAYAPPSALRFSDAEEVSRRPPSPALPEFNYLPNEYAPYITETPLAEGDLGYEAISEIVIELEPHTVMSGRIDTESLIGEEEVEKFKIDETRKTVLRPEEVLIFFENDGTRNETKTIIPFSPATPSSETIKSSATLKVE